MFDRILKLPTKDFLLEMKAFYQFYSIDIDSLPSGALETLQYLATSFNCQLNIFDDANQFQLPARYPQSFQNDLAQVHILRTTKLPNLEREKKHSISKIKSHFHGVLNLTGVTSGLKFKIWMFLENWGLKHSF